MRARDRSPAPCHLSRSCVGVTLGAVDPKTMLGSLPRVDLLRAPVVPPSLSFLDGGAIWSSLSPQPPGMCRQPLRVERPELPGASIERRLRKVGVSRRLYALRHEARHPSACVIAGWDRRRHRRADFRDPQNTRAVLVGGPRCSVSP